MSTALCREKYGSSSRLRSARVMMRRRTWPTSSAGDFSGGATSIFVPAVSHAAPVICIDDLRKDKAADTEPARVGDVSAVPIPAAAWAATTPTYDRRHRGLG